MSIYVAGAAAALWLFQSYSFSLRQKLNVPTELISQNPDDAEPCDGGYGDPRHWALVATRGRFRSVTEDTDELGAKVFLVNYGNGQKVRQYLDPRIVL